MTVCFVILMTGRPARCLVRVRFAMMEGTLKRMPYSRSNTANGVLGKGQRYCQKRDLKRKS